MSNLEHLVENVLFAMNDHNDLDDDFMDRYVKNDPNYEYVNINASDIMTICRYIFYSNPDDIPHYLRSERYNKRLLEE